MFNAKDDDLNTSFISEYTDDDECVEKFKNDLNDDIYNEM